MYHSTSPEDVVRELRARFEPFRALAEQAVEYHDNYAQIDVQTIEPSLDKQLAYALQLFGDDLEDAIKAVAEGVKLMRGRQG